MSPRWREPPREPAPSEAPIDLALIDWLLEGRPRVDDADPLRHTQAYDWAIEFDTPGPDLRALWLQHRVWLFAEWTRRGGQRQPWAARFWEPGERFCEYLPGDEKLRRAEDDRERRRAEPPRANRSLVSWRE